MLRNCLTVSRQRRRWTALRNPGVRSNGESAAVRPLSSQVLSVNPRRTRSALNAGFHHQTYNQRTMNRIWTAPFESTRLFSAAVAEDTSDGNNSQMDPLLDADNFSLENPLVNPILPQEDDTDLVVSLDQLDALAAETNQLLQARQGEKALPLLKRWVASHAAWREEFMNQQDDGSQTNNTLLLKGLLMGCNAVHDLLPCIEPRLAPYNYMEPLFATSDGFDGTVTAPRPLSPAQLWAVTLQAISLSASTMQAYHTYHTQHPPNTRKWNNNKQQSSPLVVDDRSLLKLSRGIPQRTKGLWDRLQSANLDPETPDLLQRAQNNVLSTWADSLEHARGFHAEAFFQQMMEQRREQEEKPVPNAEALRTILRAWCQSHEKGSSYHAMKHLQNMQRILRKQFDDIAQEEFDAKKKRYISEARQSRAKADEGNSDDVESKQWEDHDDESMTQSETDEETVDKHEHETSYTTEDEHDEKYKDDSEHVESKTFDARGPPDDDEPMLDEVEDRDLYPYEPSLEDYQMVLRALSKDPSNSATRRALKVMENLEGLVNSRVTIVQPDVKCFRYILTTAASRPLMNPSKTAPLLKDAWKAMEERWLVQPDFKSYAASIRAWRNIALHPSNESNNDLRDVGFKRARDLLEDSKMIQRRRYLYKGEKALPTSAYNDVLEAAIAWSADFEDKIEFGDSLLKELETGENTPKPNPRSYVNMVNLLKSSLSVNGSHREPLAEAKQVLWRMVDHLDPYYLNRKGNLQKRDARVMQRTQQAMEEQEILSLINGEGHPVDALNAFIEMCSASANFFRKDGKEGMIVFRDALAAVESFRRRKIQPNWATYATLLMAVKRLLPPGEQRSKVAEHVFTLACSDGMVEGETLKALSQLISEDRYREVVLSKSNQVEGTLVVPEGWTRIALGGERVISNDGSKSRPLSASGQLVTTMAMKEFQMRSLRDKRNQKLLRGGRWTEVDSLLKEDP